MLLAGIQHASGYASPYWLTFKQATEKKGAVRKGEKGTPVVYYNFIEKEDPDNADEKTIIVFGSRDEAQRPGRARGAYMA